MPCPSYPMDRLNGSDLKNHLKSSNRKNHCVAELIGSGVILDAEKGYIVTSLHIIEDADKITVTLHDKRIFSGKIIGEDFLTDLAIIQIKAEELKASSWANSDQLQVGDFVVAIGSPFGLDHTVTSGIISALHRNNIGLRTYENFIQTDAPINIGNSGGALINMKGELIGINTSIISLYGGNSGVGFAIPSNAVKKISEQLIKYGDVQRGQLGVYIKSGKVPDGLGRQGVYITRVVENSPAEKAGIKSGDRVISVGGQIITNYQELTYAIGLFRAHEEVNIVILRRNKKIHFELVLAESF